MTIPANGAVRIPPLPFAPPRQSPSPSHNRHACLGLPRNSRSQTERTSGTRSAAAHSGTAPAPRSTSSTGSQSSPDGSPTSSTTHHSRSVGTRCYTSAAPPDMPAPRAHDCYSPQPLTPHCISSPDPPVSVQTLAASNVHATPRTAFPVPVDHFGARESPSTPPPAGSAPITYSAPAAPAARSSAARCRRLHRFASTRAAPDPPTPGQKRILPTPGNTIFRPRQTPAPPSGEVQPIAAAATRSVQVSARD